MRHFLKKPTVISDQNGENYVKVRSGKDDDYKTRSDGNFVSFDSALLEEMGTFEARIFPRRNY